MEHCSLSNFDRREEEFLRGSIHLGGSRDALFIIPEGVSSPRGCLRREFNYI